MSSTAWHRFDEFLRLLHTPVWRTETAAEWHDGVKQFVLELYERHFLFSIMIPLPVGDAQRVLQILYRRAAPQYFMGLPIRIYRNQEQLIGSIAVPKDAVTAELLMKLQCALARMFDLGKL